jgi:Type VI secretion system/phage-baseplate injector OB domain
MAYHGLYRGSVLNTADPMMKGRVQVSVPTLAAAASGWAMPCRDYGSTTTPPVGTTVWVMFEGGNLSSPVWVGCMT